MRALISVISCMAFSACASAPSEIYDTKYSNSEIAVMTAEHFDVLESDAKVALRPTFKKYGAPHAYIDGMMSSIADADVNHLYGSGHFKTKLTLKEHTFWRVDGENLSGHLVPVKTAHLIYKTLRLDPLSTRLEFSETLTKRGQKFTLFERKLGDEIVITVHKSGELPQSELESVRFFSD